MTASRSSPSRYDTRRFVRLMLGSPFTSGGVIRLVALVLALTFVWTLFTELEVVAVGGGVLQAEDQVKIVRTMEAGIVRTLFAAEGDEVSMGQPLLALDPSAADSQMRQLEIERQRLSSQVHLAQGLLDVDEAAPVEGLLPATDADRVTQAHELAVWRRREQHQRSIEAAARAAVATAGHAYQAADDAVVFHTRRRDDVLRLVQQDFMTRHALQNVEQDVLRAQAERRRDIHGRWLESARQLAQNTAARARASAHLQRLTLRTPIDGMLLTRSTDTEGSAITPGEETFRIAPRRQPLRIEARFEHKDIAIFTPA